MKKLVTSGFIFIFSFAGCSQMAKNRDKSLATNSNSAPNTAPSRAQAVLKAAAGEKLKGLVEFTETERQMRIHVKAEGLKPGLHGFHIHDKGDCSSADFNSAGPHFNPANVQHGSPETAPQHGGDLGNILADKTGKVNVEIVVKQLTLGETPFKISGKSVIIHHDQDDFKTQPTGNAGKRIGCGVIETL